MEAGRHYPQEDALPGDPMSLPFPEYDDLDATGLAEVIRKGEVSPVEALDAALARVDA